jgi:hypothetical protein
MILPFTTYDFPSPAVNYKISTAASYLGISRVLPKITM